MTPLPDAAAIAASRAARALDLARLAELEREAFRRPLTAAEVREYRERRRRANGAAIVPGNTTTAGGDQ